MVEIKHARLDEFDGIEKERTRHAKGFERRQSLERIVGRLKAAGFDPDAFAEPLAKIYASATAIEQQDAFDELANHLRAKDKAAAEKLVLQVLGYTGDFF